MFVPVALIFLAGSLPADEYSNWPRSRTITLNTSFTGANVATNQLNFPVLIRLTTANAAPFFVSEATSGQLGADLRFSKMDGTHLSYEMKYDATNKRVTAWVKVDTVFGSRAAQQIKYYWGKAGAADSSNGAAVFSAANGFIADYHLNKALPDSSNGMHLFPDATGTMPNAYGGTTVIDTDAVIDRGRAFHQIGVQGQNNQCGDSIVVRGMMGKPKTLTFSAWVRVDSIDQYNHSTIGHRANIVSMANIASLNDAGADSNGLDSFSMGFKGAGNWNNFGYHTPAGPTLLKQGWKYVAGTVDPAAGYAAIFLNGDSVAGFASTDTIAWTSTGNTKFGKQGTYNYGEKLGGSLCEVRFESVARSADWQRLCFQNQQAADALTRVDTITPVIDVAARKASPASGFRVSAGAIRYSLEAPATVYLSMSDARGRTVWSSRGMRAAGSYRVKLSDMRLAAGSYIVRFTAAGVEKRSVVTLGR